MLQEIVAWIRKRFTRETTMGNTTTVTNEVTLDLGDALLSPGINAKPTTVPALSAQPAVLAAKPPTPVVAASVKSPLGVTIKTVSTAPAETPEQWHRRMRRENGMREDG